LQQSVQVKKKTKFLEEGGNVLGNSKSTNIFYKRSSHKQDKGEENPFLRDDFRLKKKFDPKMGKKRTDMGQINRTIKALKAHKAKRIDQLVDKEYSKCFDKEKSKMKNFKGKPSRY
jgi:hypothetical protein